MNHDNKSKFYSGFLFELWGNILPLSTGVAVKIELEPGATGSSLDC